MSVNDNSGSPLSRRHRFETFKTAVSIRNLYTVFKNVLQSRKFKSLPVSTEEFFADFPIAMS